MVRNMEATLALVKNQIPEHYQMTLEEINKLYDMGQKSLFDAFVAAFSFGYVMGHKATKNGRYKENKAQ